MCVIDWFDFTLIELWKTAQAKLYSKSAIHLRRLKLNLEILSEFLGYNGVLNCIKTTIHMCMWQLLSLRILKVNICAAKGKKKLYEPWNDTRQVSMAVLGE